MSRLVSPTTQVRIHRFPYTAWGGWSEGWTVKKPLDVCRLANSGLFNGTWAMGQNLANSGYPTRPFGDENKPA